MKLMGKANWWLPGWLDRLLPAVDIDGAKDRHATREDAMVGAAPRDTTSA
jgi:RND superfamily putative drug exporter